jgi:hypothetical protein
MSTERVMQKMIQSLFLLAAIGNANAASELFNHQNLNGWKHVGSGKFIVQDGQLVTEGGMGLLYYEKQKFTNVKLTVVYKTTTATSNSGVFVRFGEKPQDAWDAVNHGYEVQICDTGPEAADSFHSTGAVYSMSPALANAAKPVGEWNKMEIYLKEEFIKVVLNGKLVNAFSPNTLIPTRGRDSDPERGPRAIVGYIGLQNHDHTARESGDHVYFKDVSVEELG